MRPSCGDRYLRVDRLVVTATAGEEAHRPSIAQPVRPRGQFAEVASSTNGTGQQSWFAHSCRSSQPIATVAARLSRIAVRSSIRPSISTSFSRARTWRLAVRPRGLPQAQQAGDLVEGETEPLGRLDHLQPGHRVARVQAVSARAAVGVRKQPASLVVAEGLAVDTRGVRELSGAQRHDAANVAHSGQQAMPSAEQASQQVGSQQRFPVLMEVLLEVVMEP